MSRPKKRTASSNPTETHIDLHGEPIEEALIRVERFLDKALLSGFLEVVLIHGHGTGKLKEAVRSYLGESPYVERFRPGDSWEGGDGVTVATLTRE